MKIAWATDIHLDMAERPALDAFFGDLTAQNPDVVVITGDIAEAPRLPGALWNVADAVTCPVYFVLGNHDFYRSGIREVRAAVRDLDHPRLAWLPARGVVPLGPGLALVGVDGWGDARAGDPETSDIGLNDWVYIDDLAFLRQKERLEALRRFGDEEADALRGPLAEALSRFPEVIVATHVPPFPEACWHEGAVSGPDWLPFFTCTAVGEVLRSAALAHPERKILVLCGHTHGGGVADVLPNLRVLTGPAEYGAPVVQPAISWG